MRVKRECAERVNVLIQHYNAKIDEYAQDVSKVAELRGVRTLLEGVVQALSALELEGLDAKPGCKVSFYVDRASEEFRSWAKRIRSSRVSSRESSPMGMRFSQEELDKLDVAARELECGKSTVIRRALVYVGLIPDQPAASE